jgi:DNA polymerase-1
VTRQNAQGARRPGLLRPFVAFDTETHLIAPGAQAPELVCLSTARFSALSGSTTRWTHESGLVGAPDARDAFLALLASNLPLVGHNVAFDLCVLMAHAPELVEPIFAALADSRFHCTMLMGRLLENAKGTLQITPRERLAHETATPFSLAGCASRYLGRDVSEGKSVGSWRYRYSELSGVPVSDYPKEASDYAIQDAVVTGELFLGIQEHDRALGLLPAFPDEVETTLLDSAARVRAAVALRLIECWGIRTDAQRVRALRFAVDNRIVDAQAEMIDEGLMREDLTLDIGALRERVVHAFSPQKAPTTEKGTVRTDRRTLRETEDPALVAWAEAGFAQKVKSTFLRVVEQGVYAPVHARYQPLVETGRTSCSNPPLQQIPRSSGEFGVRECFVPRPGMAFVAADYDAIEMRCFAQVLLDQVGRSAMADEFQKDPDFDPHTFFAKHLASGKWDSLTVPEKKDLRSRAKGANFGFSGALGIKTFRTFCQGFGLSLSAAEAQILKTQWFNKYPEVRQYFKDISQRLDPAEQTAPLVHARSLRVRGSCTFTQSANSPFQGMSADGALHALFLVARACYSTSPDPLRGCRPVLFIHDEIILECPVDRVHAAGHRLCELMVAGMRPFVPDIPITAAPVAMDRWSKDAEMVLDSSGKLAVWKS